MESVARHKKMRKPKQWEKNYLASCSMLSQHRLSLFLEYFKALSDSPSPPTLPEHTKFHAHRKGPITSRAKVSDL